MERPGAAGSSLVATPPHGNRISAEKIFLDTTAVRRIGALICSKDGNAAQHASCGYPASRR
jgi:hypothetical protein